MPADQAPFVFTCPFCQSQPEVKESDNDQINLHFIQCPSCLARGPEVYTREFAARLWNKGVEKK